MATTEIPQLLVGPEPIDVKAEPSDLQLWSVTTIIGALDKPALIYWSAEQTALAAVNERAAWAQMANSRPDDAIEWLKNARFRRAPGARSATDLGTAVHAAVETYAVTGVRPEVDDEIRPFLDQFDGWLQRFSPSYQAVEVTVFSPTYGIAGTCDGFLIVDGTRFIIDYKTSAKSFDKKGKPTGPYPEQAGLQLAAYRYAEMAAVWRPRRFEKFRRRYYLLSAEEQALAVPVPTVDTGAVIHITPEHCEMYPIRCDEAVYESFLHTLECARWLFQDSKTAMGAPLVAPDRTVA